MIDAAADVIDFSRGNTDVFDGFFVSTDQVGDVEHVANLFAVTKDSDGVVFDGLSGKVSHPALIFNTKLMSAIDAALAKDDRTNPIDTIVIAGILVASAFTTTIGGVEV